MRVPRPAAGKIAKTCITWRVYNGRYGKTGTRHQGPVAGQELGRQLIPELHFVGGREAEGFVKRPALNGSVQGDNGDIAAAGFGKAQLDERASQAAASVLRLDKEVEDVAALRAAGVESMRGPIQKQRPIDATWRSPSSVIQPR
jgi:hypothetical protein